MCHSHTSCCITYSAESEYHEVEQDSLITNVAAIYGVLNTSSSARFGHSSCTALNIETYFSFIFLCSARTSTTRSYKTAFIRWLTKLPTVANQAPVLVRNDFHTRSCSRPRRSNTLRKQDYAAEEMQARSNTTVAGQHRKSLSHGNIPTASKGKKNDRIILKERGKRCLSSSREKQSPRVSKAICRPKGDSVAKETSSDILSPSPIPSIKLELKFSNSSLQETFPSISLIHEQDVMMEESFRPVGKKVVLPKLRLREKMPKDLDTDNNIFKHRMIRRTTISSIKRTTLINSKIIRRKTCIEKDIK